MKCYQKILSSIKFINIILTYQLKFRFKLTLLKIQRNLNTSALNCRSIDIRYVCILSNCKSYFLSMKFGLFLTHMFRVFTTYIAVIPNHKFTRHSNVSLPFSLRQSTGIMALLKLMNHGISNVG